MKYYIIESNNIETFKPLMEQSFGHNNISITKSVDNSLGLMQFTDELAPTGYIGQTTDEITETLNSDVWTENYTYEANKVLRIHEISKDFNPYIDSISNIAFESSKVFNELTGLKEITTYVNSSDEIVAIKNFHIYQENSHKGTKLVLDFYDKNGDVGISVETLDYYSEQRIRSHKGKCTIRVYERLLWDIDVELEQLQMIVDYYTDEQKTQVLPAFGLASIEQLNAMPLYMTNLFDQIFKVSLKDEIDLMYKTGDSSELFNSLLDTTTNTNLDQVAATSESGHTYRQILQFKFNPTNFEFYN